MTKQIRVSIPEELHPWLSKMSHVCEIPDYSKLVAYLLQRMKDQPVFGSVQQAITPQNTSMQVSTPDAEIQIDADW